ncbi:MAG: TIGR03668 family PPOX class F420-dependent oxidoreductase [Deltaproteobacteria bacterium]|nr:TIGR03668 family PPOX class F420-dependent oxidoreductase [Deltaproteobacteria bacterium]MBI3386764.1 TIGR03668 family PPOX class F420-dependent oxidoreductase [Deltaproteobacteria bacterium]
MPLSEEAAAFADAHRVARLATADATGAPHVIPFCYARDNDRFYFVIDDKPKRGAPLQLKRMRNLAINPKVAFVIDDYDDDWQRLAYLLVRGHAIVVDVGEEYDRILAALRVRYPQYRAMPLAFATHPMVRITVQDAHLWRSRASVVSRKSSAATT